MAFFQRIEKFIHKGTQNGIHSVKITLMVIDMNADMKIQSRKIGTCFNDEIGITHRIGHKFVGFDSAFDGDFNGFVSSDLATEISYNILPSGFILIRNSNYRGKDEQTEKRSSSNMSKTSSLELIARIASKFLS
jgi:hypothetical protein